MKMVSNCNDKKVPFVVKFGYHNFTRDDDKWSAKCKKCHATQCETKNVTSEFTK